MKIMHIADLHIGKVVNGFSMLDDQFYILNQIKKHIFSFNIDVVVIAGDVFDKQQPAVNSMQLFDSFLTDISAAGVSIMIISGNHDSGGRLSFGSGIMEHGNVYIYGIFDGYLKKITLNDEFGEVNFYLLPFIKPANVRQYYENLEIDTHNDAVKAVFENAEIDEKVRNIIVGHQFFIDTGDAIIRSDSERASIGGIDSIDIEPLFKFDYAALGHLHGPQSMGEYNIRYSGSPLKYSFSEHRHKKSIVLIDLGYKGKAGISLIPLVPLRDLRKIKGNLNALIDSEIVSSGNREDYIHVTLTDDEEIPDAFDMLRNHYPNIMELHYDNTRSNTVSDFNGVSYDYGSSEIEMFTSFYFEQNGSEMKESQLEIVSAIMEENISIRGINT